MKINGFTMAEVLLTLGIIGVIAMFTLPALMNNIQKQQAGPALLRAVSTLDTANALMVEEQSMYSFKESCKEEDSKGYVERCFEPFIKAKMGAYLNSDSVTYKNFSSPETFKVLSDGYTTKNGITYFFDSEEINAEDTELIKVYIDINGTEKKPNELGKDLFITLMDFEEEGRIYAYGSRAHSYETGKWEDTCNQNNVTDASYCAGSIIDNGGKAIYPWYIKSNESKQQIKPINKIKPSNQFKKTQPTNQPKPINPVSKLKQY